jgi:hypothetical protein
MPLNPKPPSGPGNALRSNPGRLRDAHRHRQRRRAELERLVPHGQHRSVWDRQPQRQPLLAERGRNVDEGGRPKRQDVRAVRIVEGDRRMRQRLAAVEARRNQVVAERDPGNEVAPLLVS